MRFNFLKPYKSITAPVTEDALADFVVLSGANGAGKSHLLEAIRSGAIQIDGITLAASHRTGPDAPEPIRLIKSSQLVARAENRETNLAAYRDTWRNLHRLVNEHRQQASAQGRESDPDRLELEVRMRLERAGQISPEAVQKMVATAGKRLIHFTDDDFCRYAPVISGIRNPFAMTIAEIFLSYHGRLERNEVSQWRKDTGRSGGDVALSNEEFEALYGPAPWDLLNETLRLVGLDYQLNRPEGYDDYLPYHVQLTHHETSVQIGMSELSSGEQTLMAVAMSLYSGSYLGEAIELPQILLLDEPDNSLHPSMVRSLLRVVDDIFCKRHGIKVLMVTHAPSTVALAPEESLYTLRRTGDPRLRRASSRDEALKDLMIGLPTLSVRNEYRRQVFVESDNDEGCYQELFRLLRDKLKASFSLEFIASGRGGQGNDGEVKRLVQKLRGSGNLVQGIIDRDQRSGAPDGVVFIERRRTLENLVLDPLLVGLFLLREQFVRSEDIVGESLRHFEVQARQAQAICDYVVSRVRQDGDDEEKIASAYVGGFEVLMPKFYLEIDGHLLEERLRVAFSQLNKYSGGLLKAKVIGLVVADVPDFAPQDVIDLFQRLAG